MRIAVASQGLDVASKVLRCASYMCYRVDRGMIVDCQNMPNLSLPPAQLATLMKDLASRLCLRKPLSRAHEQRLSKRESRWWQVPREQHPERRART